MPSSGSVTSYFDELRQARMRVGQQGNVAQSYWQASVVQRPVGFGSGPNDAIVNDPFRSRRGPSSRAPSKHVDEYEAQQAKQAEFTTDQPTGVLTDSTESPSPEPSLDQIPEWNEFVTSGNERGIDVMGILKVSNYYFNFYYYDLQQTLKKKKKFISMFYKAQC